LVIKSILNAKLELVSSIPATAPSKLISKWKQQKPSYQRIIADDELITTSNDATYAI
jgi:hypothetical protein